MPDDMFDWNSPGDITQVPPGPKATWNQQMKGALLPPPPQGQSQQRGQNQGQGPGQANPAGSALAGGLSAGFAAWLAHRQAQQQQQKLAGLAPPPPQIYQPAPAAPDVQVPQRYQLAQPLDATQAQGY